MRRHRPAFPSIRFATNGRSRSRHSACSSRTPISARASRTRRFAHSAPNSATSAFSPQSSWRSTTSRRFSGLRPAATCCPPTPPASFAEAGFGSVRKRRSACTDPGDIDYSVGGKPLASATAILTDQSALCDKLTVNIRTTTIIPKLEVSISPKRGPYVPGDATRGSVNLRVTLHDVSPPGSGGNILLKGNILTCNSEVRVGRSMISKTTQIDLQHCSTTVHQPCGSDAECAPPACNECVPNE